MVGSVIKNAADFDGAHRFLAEELLQPMTNRCDGGRNTMFTAQMPQVVILNNPERPRVFSRFENIFGSHTTAVKTLPADAEVIGIFEKNCMQRVYALRYPDGKLEIHFATPARHLTENYGYLLNNPLEQVQVGDILPAGAPVQGWSSTDEYGNMQYGLNMRTVYVNKEGLTYEDSTIASASAAERFAHTSIEHITVVINANDITTNSLGTSAEHKGFADVGEEISDGRLLSRRRINHESILYDLAEEQLSKINWESDKVFYAEGTVVDIDVYSNLSENELDKHSFNSQILKYHRKWLEFRTWFTEIFSEACTAEVRNYSDDVAYWWRICRDTAVSPWRHDRKEFDGVVLQFTIAKRNPLRPGSKVSNRYGGKTTIGSIRPDSEMPRTESGKIVDFVINTLGVINRLNPVQLFESELNFIADEVALQMQAMNIEDATAHMLKFMQHVSPAWFEEVVTKWDDATVMELAAEVQRGEQPIFIHQPPFFGTITLDGLRQAYRIFNVEKEFYIGMEEPQIPGNNYYVKLRHEPESKMSARSAKHLSISGVPTKNSRGVRTNTEHHSTTPIRLGEQELQNLLIANNPDELKRFLRLYATDDLSREGAIAELVTRADPFSRDRIDPQGSGITRPVAGLKALLESIGLDLQTSDEQTLAEAAGLNTIPAVDIPVPLAAAIMEITDDEEVSVEIQQEPDSLVDGEIDGEPYDE